MNRRTTVYIYTNPKCVSLSQFQNTTLNSGVLVLLWRSPFRSVHMVGQNQYLHFQQQHTSNQSRKQATGTIEIFEILDLSNIKSYKIFELN